MTRIRTAAAVTAAAAATAAAMVAVAGLSLVAARPVQARTAAAPHVTKPDAAIAFPLHTSGASIVDANGSPVKLNLVNWYGAESPDYVVGGLAYQPISEIISKIVSMGFNGVRLPWSNQMWESNPVVSGTYLKANTQFDGDTADTAVDEWSYWGGGNQQFVVQKDSSGSYTIASINSMDDIEVPGSSGTAGTLLDQGTPTGGANQEWTFSPA